jgi:hypothetical protein
MSGAAAPLILGFLLATVYGAAFHLVLGGPARRILLYLLAAWLGFTIGHIIGEWLNFHVLVLGPVNLLSASLGAWLALIVSWWLAGQQLPS